MRVVIAFAAALMLAACNFTTSTNEQPEAPQQAETVTLTASGQAESLQPLADDQPLQWAASVTRVDDLEQGGVKLFGLAGGDPAMNGLYTQIAFFQNAAEGWRVFRIGDFLEYRIVGQSPGRVDLEISESTMNAETGEIGSQTRHLIVAWTPATEGAPDAISVTPATAD